MHCGKILDKGTSQCNCEKSNQERIQERLNKDLETWNNAKKISLQEAIINRFGMVYVDNYDRYFTIDEFEDWLADNEDDDGKPLDKSSLRIYSTHTIDLSMDASSIIENACSDLHDDAMDNISTEDEKELQILLDKWCEDNRQGTTTYYADFNVGINL